MPLRFIDRIIDHLSHQGYRPSLPKVIARELRIPSDDRIVFKQAIKDAAAKQLVEIGRDGCIRLPAMPEEVLGK